MNQEEARPESTCETCRYQGGSCETRRSNCAIPCGDWERKSSFKPVEKRYSFEWSQYGEPTFWIAQVDRCFHKPIDCIYLKGFKHFLYGEVVTKNPYWRETLPTAVVFEEDNE